MADKGANPAKWHLEFDFILASQSQRRAHLLSLIGFQYSIIHSHLDEGCIVEPDPIRHVTRLSSAKAENVAGQITQGVIIAADTIVVLDGRILGKPGSPEHACAMLRQLSGRTHEVYTGYTLLQLPQRRLVSEYERSCVHFRELAEWEIHSYVESKSPMDKAGAYGIQDQSAVFVDRIEGCFYNVVGLPLAHFYATCMDFLIKKTR